MTCQSIIHDYYIVNAAIVIYLFLMHTNHIIDNTTRAVMIAVRIKVTKNVIATTSPSLSFVLLGRSVGFEIMIIIVNKSHKFY